MVSKSKNEKFCGVYAIRNVKNGTIYVGSSKDIESRWAQHIYMLNNGVHDNIHLQRAWSKYTSKNFSFEILEETNIEDRFQVEQEYIDEFLLNGFELYNIETKVPQSVTGGVMIERECHKCHKTFKSHSHLSKYCDDCKDEMKKESYRIFQEAKQYYVNDEIVEEDVLIWGYDNWDDFWESFV